LNRKKTGIAVVFFIALALFTQFCPYCIRNPFKVTNPESTWFNPDRFQFIDYINDKKLVAALRKTVPPGTPKEVAERRLTRWNNTSMRRFQSSENAYSFCWNPAIWLIRIGACIHNVGVYYDENGKVKQVNFNGELFPE